MEEIKSIRISELKDFKNHSFSCAAGHRAVCPYEKVFEDEGV